VAKHISSLEVSREKHM